MSRISSNDTDTDGVVRNGFDYALQVWIVDYICQAVGLNRDKYAGLDVRTIPGHSRDLEEIRRHV